VRNVRKLLDSHDIRYTFHDFDIEPVDEAMIVSWIGQGATLEVLFNKKSTTYRQLGLKNSVLSDTDKIVLLTKENRLIKRPVAILPTQEILVGAVAAVDHFTPKQGK
jgi:arsenate reductase